MELKINNKKFDFFNSFNMTLKYDAIASAFSFNVYFNPENPDHKELMQPGAYNSCEVIHNGETLIKGVIISQTFNNSPVKQLSALGGYSFTGVLEDCEIPTSIYPLQSDGLTLKEIAEKIIKPFGLSMVIDSAVEKEMGEVYDVSKAKVTQSCKAYLSELAAQKNVIISHTAKGSLLFTKAKTNQKPFLNFPEATTPATSMSLSFNGQAMHNSITVMKEADADGGNAGEATISNPLCNRFRPKVLVQSSGDDIDTEKAARTALSNELKNVVLTITTDRWEVDEKIIKPNSIISVHNHELYLYKKTNWFVEEITFVGDNKQTTATMKCVLPSVYDNSTPSNIFHIDKHR